MSLHALTWAFQQSLPCAHKMVLVALADNANAERRCWPSQRYLAAKCGLARQSVNAIVADLRKQGFITVEPGKRKDGGATASIYLLNMPGEPLSPELTAPVGAEDTPLSGRDDTPLSAEATPKKNRKSKPPKEPSPALPGMEYPDWIPKKEFERFVENRKAMRRPMTPHAIDLMIASLDDHRKAGHDLAKLLNEAVRKGWQDVYVPDAKGKPLGGDVISVGEWETALEIFFRGATVADGYGGKTKVPIGIWQSRLGPPPGAAGCRAPAEIVARVKRG